MPKVGASGRRPVSRAAAVPVVQSVPDTLTCTVPRDIPLEEAVALTLTEGIAANAPAVRLWTSEWLILRRRSMPRPPCGDGGGRRPRDTERSRRRRSDAHGAGDHAQRDVFAPRDEGTLESVLRAVPRQPAAGPAGAVELSGHARDALDNEESADFHAARERRAGQSGRQPRHHSRPRARGAPETGANRAIGGGRWRTAGRRRAS
jgi:hypothetical protein